MLGRRRTYAKYMITDDRSLKVHMRAHICWLTDQNESQLKLSGIKLQEDP